MRSFRELAARLRQLLVWRREDAETAMELRFHLEMEEEKNLRAGLPPREAHRQAHVRLGGTEAVREAVRDAHGTRLLEDLIRDLGYAFRAARGSPVFTLAAVVSLAIPIAFNTTVFSVVDAVLFRPLPVARPAQLVDVWTGLPELPYTTTSYPDYVDLRAENDVLTDVAAHAPMLAVAWVDGNTTFVLGETVTGNYFDLLGVRPVLGRLLAPADDDPAAPRVAVISSGLWERLFDRDPNVVGRILRVRARSYVVVGVAPPEFGGMPPIPGPNLWVPMAWVEDLAPFGISTLVGSLGEPRLEHRGYRWMFVKGRLRDGITAAQAAANLDVIMADLAASYPESNENQQLSLTLTNDVRLPPQVGEPVYLAATGLRLVVGVVLLVACANVMGMLLARSVARRREIAVRLAIGASRRRLVRQLLTEGLLLSSVGAVTGLAMTWTLLRWVAVEAPEPLIPFALGFVPDARAFVFTATVATGAGVLAALVPALQATRLSLLRDLSGAVPLARSGGRRWFLRDALVAAQLALTVPLMVLAAVSIRGAAGSTTGTALGFDPDRVAVVSSNLGMLGYDPERADRFRRDALDRVRSMPGVVSAAMTTRPPLDISFSPARVLIPGHHGPADRGAAIGTVEVTRDYFRTLEVPLLRGRTFTTADTPDSPRVAVVSEAMALRYWPEGTALGQRIHLDNWGGPEGEVEVVGVAADYKVQFPTEAPAAYLHLAASQRTHLRGVLLARTAGDASVLAADIDGELRRSEPDLIFTSEAGTLRDTVDVTVLPFRVAASVAGASGIVAAVLGVIGLYGVIAFLIVRRTGEMAIRSALGARPGALLRHVLATGGWVVAVGLGSGTALAFLVMRVYAEIAAGIATADPVVWASVPLLLVVVCALAFVVPALRIVRLDVPRALQVH